MKMEHLPDRFRFRVWYKGEGYKESTYSLRCCEDGPYLSWFSCDGCEIENLDDVIVEQCTGLRDRNDTLIYEGDIVKATDPPYNLTKHIHWNGRWYQLGESDIVLCDMEVEWYGLEIIGTIHDQQEGGE